MADDDPQAGLALARRLLVGPGGNAEREEGAHLAARAAARGDADAALFCALLAAAGVGRPQDWDHALDQLQIAAERGHGSAEAQLRLLSGASSSDPPLTPSQWRQRIDLEAWLTPPPRTVVSEAPRVRSIAGFLAPEVCRWVMALAAGRLQPATMYNPTTGRDEPHPGRTNDLFMLGLLDADVVVALIRARISAAVKIPGPCFEPTQVFHYAVGREIAAHYDYLEARKMKVDGSDQPYEGQRIATFLVYLNGDYEGGATVFPKVDVSFKGKTGDALFFANVDGEGRPDRLSLHAGTPPTRGEKWIISQWIHDRPFTGVTA
jgi:prolyl 4-hydroxylase